MGSAYFRQFRDSATETFSYMVGCAVTARALLIDPVSMQVPLYLGVIKELGLKLEWVLETHLHSDHLSGADELRECTGARIAASRQSGIEVVDKLLSDGDMVSVGAQHVTVIATPGHTPGCLTYCWEDRLFTGDSLLIGGCGDLDEPRANGVALYDSVTRRLLCLADETLVYPGHCLNGRRVSCIGEERERNPFFHGVSRDHFVAVRNGGHDSNSVARQSAIEANRLGGRISETVKVYQAGVGKEC